MSYSAPQSLFPLEQIRRAFVRSGTPGTLLCGHLTKDNLRSIAKLDCPIVSVIGRQSVETNGESVTDYGWYCEESCSLVPPAAVAKRVIVLGDGYELGARIAVQLVKEGARWFEFGEVRKGAGRFLSDEFTKALVRRASGTPLARIARWRTFKEARRLVQTMPAVRDSEDKVVFAIGSLGPGGSERQLTLLLNAFAKNGATKCELVVERELLPPHDFFASAVSRSGVPIRCLGSVNRDRAYGEDPEKYQCIALVAKALGISEHRLLRYYNYFCSSRPKVAHLWLDDINVEGGLAALIAGVPRIILGCRSLAPYNFSLNQPHFRDGYRLLLSSPRVVMLNNSSAGAEDYAQWCGVPRSSVTVVNNGFDFSALWRAEDAFHANNGAEKHGGAELIVGSVMRMSEEKRPVLWLQIAEELYRLNKSVRFVVYGDGPLRGAVESFIRSRGLTEVLRIPGPADDAVDAISKMHLFLLTSRAEGLPNVLIEAQAVGVPVAAFDVGGVRECIHDGVTGRVITKDSPQEVAAVLHEMLSDENWRSEARKQAPVFVRSKFDLAKMLARMKSFYEGGGHPVVSELHENSY